MPVYFRQMKLRKCYRFLLRILLLFALLPIGCRARPTPVQPVEGTPTASPSPSSATRYEYDATGNLATRTDPNGATIRYEYDVENRLTHIRYPDGSEVTYAYDVMGRRTRMTDPLGTTTYAYDLYGRLIRVTDPGGNSAQYRYDVAGNLTDLVYPDGSVVRYDYDVDGLLTTVTDVAGATTYGYDEAGRLASRTLPNGITTRYAYDTAGRLVSITHVNRAGQTLLAFEYTLDAAGRCTQVVETGADGQRLTTRYGYDALSRLTEVTQPDGQTACYTYDVVGNRTAMATSKGETTYTYDEANRLLSLTEPDGGVTTFAYDANGNLIERHSPEKTTRYTYDYENRLVRVEDGATAVEFLYDGDGNRVAKIVNGARTEYVNHINSPLPQVLLERDAGGETRYTLGDHVLAQTTGATGEALYLLEDRLDSTMALAGQDGTLAATFHYDGFGTISPASDVISPYGFTGERYDLETGLLYLRARYYAPDTGRFISADALSGLLWDPQSQNQYAYARNNPANLVDPSGLQPPYPYDRDRYGRGRMPPYTGPAWTTPSELGYTRISPSPSTGTLPDPVESAMRAIAMQLLFGGVSKALGPELGPLFTTGRGFWSAWSRAQGIPYDPILLRYYGQTESVYALASPLAFQSVGYSRPVSQEDIEAARLGIALHTAFWGPYAFSDQALGHLLGGYSGVSGSSVGGQYYLGEDSGDLWDNQRRCFFPPPCPPFCGDDDGGGGGGGAVGGVLLDRSAEVLVNLNDIAGATYDPTTGQLILIGQTDLALPPMNLDDLVVAIRAVYAGEDPGVTMVPVDPSWRDSTQRVEYFGHTEDTHFGWVMFEADRYLKSLAAGQDTLTGEPVTPDVPGFRPEIELAFEQRTAVPWHRNWFVPDEIVLNQAEDGNSMVFERATMRVESRFVRFLSDGTQVDVPGSSPVTDQFTQFLTEHYDEFAREKPELTELVQLAKIVGLVRWLRDNDIPVDLSWVEGYQVAEVETPRTTPGVSAQMCTADNTYCTVSMGGVDYTPENVYQGGDDRVATLRDRVLASRPPDLPLTWEFEQDGQTYTAVTLNVAPAQVVGGYSAAVHDLQMAVNGGLTVDFTRYYNSLNLEDGPMGPGWSFTRYALHVEEIPKPVGETEMGKEYSIKQHVALMTGSGREAFTGPYVDGAGQQFFLPEHPSSPYRDILVHGDGTYTLRRHDQINVHFDAQGRVSAVEDKNGNRFACHYDERGRLVSITDEFGQGITLSYDEASLLIQITASDGRMVSYGYDASGRLASVSDASGLMVSYVYDANDRLVEIQDSEGHTLLQNHYDDLGRLLSQTDGAGYQTTRAYDPTTGQVTYTDPDGNRFVQVYEASRLVQQTDPRNNTVRYDYDDAGNLTSVTDERGNATLYGYDEWGNLLQIQSPSGALTRISYDAESRPTWAIGPENMMTTFEYDEQDNLSQVTGGLQVVRLDPDGSVTYDESQAYAAMLAYDSTGYLVGITDAQGNTARIEHDDRGNVTAVQTPGGRLTRMEYDGRSRLASIVAPLSYTVGFGYDERGHLTHVTTAAGATRYEYDPHGDLVGFVDPMGLAAHYEYDLVGRLISVTEPTGAVTGYEYDASGNLTKTIYPNGTQRQYEYDAIGRLVSETYGVLNDRNP